MRNQNNNSIFNLRKEPELWLPKQRRPENPREVKLLKAKRTAVVVERRSHWPSSVCVQLPEIISFPGAAYAKEFGNKRNEPGLRTSQERVGRPYQRRKKLQERKPQRRKLQLRKQLLSRKLKQRGQLNPIKLSMSTEKSTVIGFSKVGNCNCKNFNF